MIDQPETLPTQEPLAIRPRLDWVDNAKALLIFLVVLGHFGSAAVAGRSIIYAFHVPAFLIITGFLLPTDFGSVTPRQLWQKWIGIYIRAYVLFSAIAVLIWWTIASIANYRVEDPIPSIIGSAYGVSGIGLWFIHDNRPLWYFTFLVTAMLGAWICAVVVRFHGPLIGGFLVMAYASVAIIYHGPRLPWCLDIAGMGTALILTGYVLRHHVCRVQAVLMAPRTALLWLPLFSALLVLLALFNGPVNINRSEFGQSGVVFLLAAICGTAVVALLSALIPASSLARRISDNTLTIFALHIYLVRVADALPVSQAWLLQQIIMVVLAATIVLAGLPLSRVLQPVLRRWVMLRPERPASISAA